MARRQAVEKETTLTYEWKGTALAKRSKTLSGMLQGSVLGLVSFNKYVNDINKGFRFFAFFSLLKYFSFIVFIS